MGLGFYGRSFTASSSSCLEPGCSFESAGESGKCSRDVGVLLNSEIDELVEEHAVTPKLYKDAAVKVAAWDDQWVAYEDEETLKLKSEFAQSRCLGGLMVWSISHDTADAKYSKALGRVANNREVSHSLEKRQDNAPAYEFDDIQNPQCKWTNCGEGKSMTMSDCLSGLTRNAQAVRADGRTSNALMAEREMGSTCSTSLAATARE